MLTKIGFGTLTKEKGKVNGDECIIFDLDKYFCVVLNSFLIVMTFLKLNESNLYT